MTDTIFIIESGLFLRLKELPHLSITPVSFQSHHLLESSEKLKRDFPPKKRKGSIWSGGILVPTYRHITVGFV